MFQLQNEEVRKSLITADVEALGIISYKHSRRDFKFMKGETSCISSRFRAKLPEFRNLENGGEMEIHGVVSEPYETDLLDSPELISRRNSAAPKPLNLSYTNEMFDSPLSSKLRSLFQLKDKINHSDFGCSVPIKKDMVEIMTNHILFKDTESTASNDSLRSTDGIVPYLKIASSEAKLSDTKASSRDLNYKFQTDTIKKLNFDRLIIEDGQPKSIAGLTLQNEFQEAFTLTRETFDNRNTLIVFKNLDFSGRNFEKSMSNEFEIYKDLEYKLEYLKEIHRDTVNLAVVFFRLKEHDMANATWIANSLFYKYGLTSEFYFDDLENTFINQLSDMGLAKITNRGPALALRYIFINKDLNVVLHYQEEDGPHDNYLYSLLDNYMDNK
jgi:hypothetical protein